MVGYGSFCWSRASVATIVGFLMRKRGRLIRWDNHQAVLLTEEFQFAAAEVFIRQDESDVLLMPKSGILRIILSVTGAPD